MSDFDDKKNNKKPTDDGSTVDTMAVKKPIGDGLVITTVTARTVVIFFGLRPVGLRQGNVLLRSTSLAWFMSSPVWEM